MYYQVYYYSYSSYKIADNLLPPPPQRTMKSNVIVMELCTGGSLYEVIDSPENAYGLNEQEFRQVIHDVGEYH